MVIRAVVFFCTYVCSMQSELTLASVATEESVGSETASRERAYVLELRSESRCCETSLYLSRLLHLQFYMI